MFFKIKRIISAKTYINKFIKENHISIVHSHGFRADRLLVKIAGIQSVSTLHNYPYYDYPMTYGNIKGFIMAKMYRSYLQKIDELKSCIKIYFYYVKRVK